MGVDNSKVIVKLIPGNLYKIKKTQYLYINKFYHVTGDVIYPVLDLAEYNDAIFLYVGYFKHEDAEFGVFDKFFYNNEYYLTEKAARFAPTYEEVEIT